MAPCSIPTILLVEDCKAYREYLASVLSEFGYSRVVEAQDGLQALEHIRLNSVDLVVSDFGMSPLSGLDLLREIRERLAMVDLPFIMVTAVGDDATVSQAERHGVTIYLKKPLHLEHFRKAIVEALRGKVAKSLSQKYIHLRPTG